MKSSWYVRVALALSLSLPVYFMIAALGTKFGIWGWRTGLGTMVIGAAPILIGAVTLVALLAVGSTMLKPPRNGWKLAVVALAIPLAIFAGLAALRARSASIPPIHDVATDTVTPPLFSTDVLAKRKAADANPIIDYHTPMGTLEPWKGERFAAIAGKTNAQVVRESYGDLSSIPLGDTGAAVAINVVADVMRETGLLDIRINGRTNSVEGVAETFWYGFKDDVVGRVADGKIDFRSVSRVGLSDLGANAARIAELRERVQAKLAG